MARLFSKDYHEHSASWYFNHAIIVLEAGDLEYWRSVDEQGLYHLRFFPRPEVRHHFCQRLDLVYDPVSQLIVRHECSECGEEELCRHFLSLLRYAYHHLKTDIFDSPAVETCSRDDLRISENWSETLSSARLELEGLYDPGADKVRFYHESFAPIDLPYLVRMAIGDSLESYPARQKDEYLRNLGAISGPRMSFLSWLQLNKSAYSVKGKFYSIYKRDLGRALSLLMNCGDLIRIRETGETLKLHTQPYPLSLRIEPAGKRNFVVLPVIVDELSAWIAGYPTWLVMRDHVYPVWFPFSDQKTELLMGRQLLISHKDLVYYRTVVHHELRRHDIYLDFDPGIELPQIVDSEPRISLELKRGGDLLIMEGWLRYPEGEEVPLSVTRFNSSLVRCDFRKDSQQGNGWFYLPPRIFQQVKDLMDRFPEADRRRVEEYSQISFQGDTAINALRERVFSMGDEDWDLVIAEDLGDFFVQKVPISVQIDARRGDEIDWFSYDVRYSYRDYSFCHEELKRFFRSNEEFMHTKDGRLIFISNREVFDEMERLISRSEKYKDSIYRARLVELPYYQRLMMDRPAIRLIQDEWLDKMSADLLRRHLEKTPALPVNLQTILRGYQKAGVAWLKMLQHYGLNGILADEMGLGKTIQALSVIHGTPEGRVSLLICPKTLLYNWAAEIEKFHTNIPYLVVEGGKSIREDMLREPNVKLLLISYSLVLNDIALLRQINFYWIVLDEAQNIKNVSAQRTAAIKKLGSEHRLALSGTPVENNLTELWSIYDFLMPGYLRSLKRFRDDFIGAEDSDLAPQRLHRMVSPFLLRRIKKEVLLELPDKQEQVSWCKLGSLQEKTYLQVIELVQKQLFPTGTSGAVNYIHVLAALTKLRQICNHPHLVNPDINPDPEASAKLEQLLELVGDSLASGHKVLVFSQFVQMLTIIRACFEARGIMYSYLDGQTKDRMAVVNEFEGSSDKRVFLISLKAGGTGLNLTSADTVILYDPWWNPMVENQAIDRAHRIGQTNKVQVFRLISKGTVEEKILALQQSKLAMFDAVISEGQQLLGSLSSEDIRGLFSYQ
ncbi:MAG TPA: DEAD/DEAH box helicase [Candidatus Cloacimonadota bacterium]|nr:DEAD/DEAH box helicase [Candidatus Cloacimonadota bacterium]